MANMKYCPKCGWILPSTAEKCWCEHSIFEINPKWGITDEKDAEYYSSVKYGEKTKEEYEKDWDEYCRPFIEEFVIHHPDFDQWSFEHHDEIKKQYIDRMNERISAAFARSKNQSYNPNPSVTCPYCKSSNTKKISAAGRMFSAGLFGFGSKKIGKQWHCNGCGSDF